MSKPAPQLLHPYERRPQRAPETEEVTMRKIVAGLFMSLDGVVESPEKWGFQYADAEVWKGVAAGVAQADAVLMGRRTYEKFAQVWPSQGTANPMAAFLNNSPKYVLSTTLETLDWPGSTRIPGDLPGALAKLKRQPGKNIQIPGSPTLVRTLLRDGLLDQLSLNICPIVVGTGLRLFDEMIREVRLKVVESTTFSTGLVGVTYQPASV
jgi:dihydrofolate reductase